MANGQTYNRARGGHQAGRRQSNRPAFDKQKDYLQRAGYRVAGNDTFGEPIIERVPWHPSTNAALMSTGSHLHEQFQGGLGLTANETKVSPKKVEINIDKQGELARVDERVPADELTTRDSLAEQSIVQEKDGQAVTLEGEFPIDVASTLIIGDQAVAFRRPEHMTSITRGEIGSTGPAQTLPKTDILNETNEEHFIIGKKQGQEVIVAVATGESEAHREGRIREAKERVTQGLRARLQDLMANPHANHAMIKKLNEKIHTLEKARPVVFLNESALPSEVEDSFDSIEAKINGQKETLRGLVHFDQVSKIMTIARPVRIDPKSAGIDPDSLQIFDGTGLERELRVVQGNERSLSPLTRRMLSGLRRPEVVQDHDKEVKLLPPISARLYSRPSAVPQQAPIH